MKKPTKSRSLMMLAKKSLYCILKKNAVVSISLLNFQK